MTADHIAVVDLEYPLNVRLECHASPERVHVINGVRVGVCIRCGQERIG